MSQYDTVSGKENNMEIKDYMKLPYTRLVQEINDESGHYFYGKILELDGCQIGRASCRERVSS